jgi:hypothetical protein
MTCIRLTISRALKLGSADTRVGSEILLLGWEQGGGYCGAIYNLGTMERLSQ